MELDVVEDATMRPFPRKLLVACCGGLLLDGTFSARSPRLCAWAEETKGRSLVETSARWAAFRTDDLAVRERG
jgi:hypothetical protein